MKKTLRACASYLSVFAGLTALGRRFGSYDGALILYGHRIATDDEGYMQGLAPQWLEEQLDYLTRHYRFIRLSDLVKHIELGERVAPRTVVITMDDGFRDNYTHGLPLFRKYEVPVTIFVTTGCLDSGELPWSQRLGCLFQQTSAKDLCHPLTDQRRLPLITGRDRKAAYSLVKKPMGKMGRIPREEVLVELERRLEARAPADRMMTWDMAREMTAAGMEIGGHTVSHSLLANVDRKEAEEELDQSRASLARELDVREPSFCFPAGSWTPELVQVVRELGYRSAFTSRRSVRLNQTGAVDSYSLSRIGMPNNKGIFLHAEIDGPLHLMRGIIRRAS